MGENSVRHEVQVEVLRELMGQLDAGVNADAGGIRMCPTDTYTNQDLLDREWETFFLGHPQVIGLSGDLPDSNSFITSEDVGVPILGTRDSSGKFRAFLNSCRHRGSMVVHERRGSSAKFSCMFHGWTYDSAGSLVGVPMREHFGEFDPSCRGLIELPAMEKHGFLWVGMNPDVSINADSLFEGLEDDLTHWGWDQYAFIGEQSFDMRLNWKLATDTFGETYHFKRLHRNTLAKSFHGDVLSYRSYERNHRMVLCLKSIDQLRGQAETNWHIHHGGFPVYFLYPNVVINVSNRRIVVVRVYPDPKDPGRSISRVGYYGDPETISDNPELGESFGEGFSAVVEKEDYALAVTTQRAAESGLQDYVIFGRNEPPLHHYHNTFRKALGMDELPLYTDAPTS